MTEQRGSRSTPGLEWLERVISVWAENTPISWASTHPYPEEVHTLAEHILGNWLMVEDAQVWELVEAAKEAEAQLDVLRQLAGARQTPTQRRLDAALAPFERKGAP